MTSLGGSRRDAITNRVVKEVRGFVAARMKKLLNRVVYPPPNLPQDFDPHRRLKLHQQKIRIDNLQLQVITHSMSIALMTSFVHSRLLLGQW